MIHQIIHPELLAPAGDWESLKAAAANGADAVYFGLDEFNARRRAKNFTITQLPEVIEFLHRRNVRGYIAFNTLIFSDELLRAQELILAIADAGVDAVIVQDLGFASLIHQLVPTLPIHASTQMTLTEPLSMEWVRKYGVRRVILPRELSLKEIKNVVQETDLELEIFVHGALCISYSGQCLASESLGGRSANRGLCAQACRLPYQIFANGRPLDDGKPAYRLSPKDLALYDRMQELVDLGIKSFKIEGRLKDSVYVAATTRIYRASLDAAVAKKPFKITEQQNLQLIQGFSRGFTHGFNSADSSQNLIRKEIPKSSGIRLGVVVGKTNRGVVVALEKVLEREIQNHLKPGDGIAFGDGLDHCGQGGRVFEVRPMSRYHGQKLSFKSFCELIFEKGKIDADKISKGTVVRKTDDPFIKKQIQQTYAQDDLYKRLFLSMKIKASLNEAFQIEAQDEDGCKVEILGNEPLKTAIRYPTTLDVIREHLSRLGNTPFQLADLDMENLDSVMIPKSVLNQMRRRVIDEISKKHFSKFKHSIVLKNQYTQIARGTRQEPLPKNQQSNLYVLVRTVDQLETILSWNPKNPIKKPSLIYCDFQNTEIYRKALSMGRSAGMGIGLATPRILKFSEKEVLKTIGICKPDAILVRSLGALKYFQTHYPDIPRVGDFSLNIANEKTAHLLIQEGFLRLVPSFDLRWEELKAMLQFESPDVFEIVVHQHMPMFYTQYCIFCAYYRTDPGHCSKPCFDHKLVLKDRKDICHPVLADAYCRNTVFNGRPQSAVEFVFEMKGSGIRNFRLDLLNENSKEICFLLECYGSVIFGPEEKNTLWDQLREFNVTRGTWT